MNQAIIITIERAIQEKHERILSLYANFRGRSCCTITMKEFVSDIQQPHYFFGVGESQILISKDVHDYHTLEFLLITQRINICQFPGFIYRDMPPLIILTTLKQGFESFFETHNIHTI